MIANRQHYYVTRSLNRTRLLAVSNLGRGFESLHAHITQAVISFSRTL